MAKGRMLSRTLGASKKFSALTSDTYRLIYCLLLPHMDCKGRYSADPVEVNAYCLTRLGYEVSLINLALEDLARVALIELYIVDGKEYLQIVDFEKHNKPYTYEKPQYPDPSKTQDKRNVDAMLTQCSSKQEATLNQPKPDVAASQSATLDQASSNVTANPCKNQGFEAVGATSDPNLLASHKVEPTLATGLHQASNNLGHKVEVEVKEEVEVVSEYSVSEEPPDDLFLPENPEDDALESSPPPESSETTNTLKNIKERFNDWLTFPAKRVKNHFKDFETLLKENPQRLEQWLLSSPDETAITDVIAKAKQDSKPLSFTTKIYAALDQRARESGLQTRDFPAAPKSYEDFPPGASARHSTGDVRNERFKAVPGQTKQNPVVEEANRIYEDAFHECVYEKKLDSDLAHAQADLERRRFLDRQAAVN